MVGSTKKVMCYGLLHTQDASIHRAMISCLWYGIKQYLMKSQDPLSKLSSIILIAARLESHTLSDAAFDFVTDKLITGISEW